MGSIGPKTERPANQTAETIGRTAGQFRLGGVAPGKPGARDIVYRPLLEHQIYRPPAEDRWRDRGRREPTLDIN